MAENELIGKDPGVTGGVPHSKECLTPNASSTYDLSKRRLLRSVAAAGPVLLTLRSGALAAASCTPVKSVGVTVNSDGQIQFGTGSPSYGSSGTPGTPPADALAPQPDVCYILSADPQCPDMAPSNGNTPLGAVTFNSSTNTYTCGSYAPGTPTQVAILSWGAAQSISA